jgi:hypothetical protein
LNSSTLTALFALFYLVNLQTLAVFELHQGYQLLSSLDSQSGLKSKNKTKSSSPKDRIERQTVRKEGDADERKGIPDLSQCGSALPHAGLVLDKFSLIV